MKFTDKLDVISKLKCTPSLPLTVVLVRTMQCRTLNIEINVAMMRSQECFQSKQGDTYHRELHEHSWNILGI